MINDTLVIRCELCGHIEEVSSYDTIDELLCSDCGYDKFSIIEDNTKKEDSDSNDYCLEISEEPKDCILYLVTQRGETMVITKKSKFAYHSIDRVTADMRLYTYAGAHSARDALLKKYPNWILKVKQFKH